MLRADTVKGYAALRSAEYRSVARAEEYVEWAQHALEAELETPSVLRLAIQDPPFFTPDLRRLFDAAVAELGIEPLSGEQALVLHAQQIAAQLRAGSISPIDAGLQIARIFTLEMGPPEFGQWQLIDEALDCDYCRASFAGDQTLDDAIVEEAAKLLDFDWRAA